MTESQEYLAHLRRLGIDETCLVADASGSIGRTVPSARVSVDALPALCLDSGAGMRGEVADLELGDTIGAGGMGMVIDALQVALQRRVAVKRLLTAEAGPAAQAHLVQEAHVLGALEHPNVVPVHVLGRGPDGRALLVMKRIEGTAWSELIEPLFPARATAGRDPIDEQLRILMQVCNAVDFAHRKGVLHRDLKPDNVMIGSFGEVYVLDWGIAVGLRDGAPGDLPRALDERAVVGTPTYMAPEMAAAAGARIAEWTDVYLLGAILHQLVTGRPPHDFDTSGLALAHAFASPEPRYDASVPRELVAICRRAMAREPEARFPSARAVRDALADFLTHRASSQVAAEASARAAQLATLIAEGGDAATMHDLATEARFGFRAALRAWPGNDEAKAALQALLEQLIGNAFRRGNLEGAAVFVRELPEPRPELEAELARRREELKRRDAHVVDLERRQHAADVAIDAGYRARVMLVIAAVLLVPIGVLGVLRVVDIHRSSYPEALAMFALLTVTLLLVAQNARKRGTNEITRRLHRVTISGTVFVALSFLVCMLFRLELSVALALALVIAGAMASAAGALTRPRLLLSVPPLVAGAVAVALWPAGNGLIMVASLGTAIGVAALLVRRSGASATPPPEP